MRIKRVLFRNYRCFLDDEVIFSKEEDNKNINLFIAPNGGGKTEFLFSIWWAFYPDSLNFNDFTGKEATPYSLNGDLYRQLNNSPIGTRKECFVEIEFENENFTYVIKRIETFEKKSARKPTSIISCSFYVIDENGIAKPPMSDLKEINNNLERIIPQKVLSGIIFDGERMKKISSIDNESVKSIEGVISDITNKEVLISFESELASLKSHYQRLIKNYARKLNSLDLEAVAENIAIKEKELKESKLKIASINTKIPPLEQNILTISERLRELEPSRKIEIELVGATRDLKHYEDNYEKDLGSFRSLMSSEGAYMLINKLTNNLESIINNTDVPLGLNVKIVENILERDSCICGNTFNDHMRQNLFELNKKLPPNDINATIKEQCKIIQSNAKKTKENLKKLYKSMDENYQSIEETKNNVNALKTKLTESVDNIVVKLEVERAKLEDKLNAMKSEKEGLLKKIVQLNEELKKQYEIQKNLAETKAEINELQTRKDFVEKSLVAVKLIQEEYRLNALSEINLLFKDAYKNISEDYRNGRRAYLTHKLNKKYLMLTYNDADLYNYFKDIKGSNLDEDSLGEIDENEVEKAINEIKISNSTGQQTVLSLAFVKAILDYSRRESNIRDKELKKVKSYPVVIDAPFSDLSGENLDNAAASINGFSEQVLLLINNESFNSIKENIRESINSVHFFHKNKEKQCSTIEKGGVAIG